MENFHHIHLDLSKQPGRCRIAESGIGWKPAEGGDTFVIDKSSIEQASWSRGARGQELKILSDSRKINQFDGFQHEDFERIAKIFKLWFGVDVDKKERALRGWNWGKGEFGKAELFFNVQNKPAFEVPYTEILNTNLASKYEVAVDFAVGADGTADGGISGAKDAGGKGAASRDQLVEARFYIPGTVAKKKNPEGEEDDDDDDDDDDEEVEEQNAASLWYDTLVRRAEIGDVAGDTFATIMDVLHLTPRGRFDIDLYESSFRLRGKTYDYKIQYDSVKKFFLLPKPDETHTLITMGLDPPLRQGQTRYPFVVMQYKRDEDLELDLNISDDDLEGKYAGKLQKNYSGPSYMVLTHLFRGLAGKKVISPSKDYLSRHQQSGVKCSIKASEGHLFCMDKSFMFVPKPATYIAMDNIQYITMSRVGGAVSASRTFDMTMTYKNASGEQQFSNINREEQQPLEDFFRQKGLKVKNEMAEDSGLIAAALKEQNEDTSDDEVVGADRGSADEDSEEEDEDFKDEDDSDVAEEFDSAHESSGGSDSDAAMEDADDDEKPDTAEMVERPKKKAKK